MRLPRPLNGVHTALRARVVAAGAQVLDGLLEEQGPGAAPPVLVLVPPEAFHEVGRRTERRWTKVEVRRIPGTARLLVEVR
jgi:hypothetical protein